MLLCVSFAFTGCEKEAFVDETIETGMGKVRQMKRKFLKDILLLT